VRALRAAAVVICGSAASLDVVGEPLRRVLAAAPAARLASYRAAQLAGGRAGIPGLGEAPGEATAALEELFAPAAAPPPGADAV
jgi:hypothetical protein